MVSTIGLWESNSLTFFKTLFARMNNVKAGKFVDDETGESLNDVEKVLHELGIELRDQNGLFRSSADVLDEVAARWNDFDNVQQHAIATAMAGTRQQEKLITLLSNYDSALKYTETSLNSAGTATEKFGAYTESVEGRTNSLKASFEQFAMTVLNSDLISGVMGFFEIIMSGFVGVASFIEKLGGLKTVLLAVAAALAMANKGLIAYNLALKVMAGVKAIIGFFTKLKNGIMGIVQIIPNAIAAWQAYAAKTAVAGAAIQATIPVIGLVLAAITAVIGAISLANDASDEAAQEAKSAAEAAATLSSEIAELTHDYLALSDAVKTDASAKESLLQTQEELLDKLKLEKHEVEELIDKYGSYTEAIKNASIEQLKEEEREIRGGFSVVEDELVDEAEHGIFSLGFLQGHISSGDASILDEFKTLFGGDVQSTKNERDAYAAWKALEAAGYNFVNPRARGTDSDGNKFLESFDLITPDEYNDFETPEDVVKAYNDLGKALDIAEEAAGDDNFLYDELWAQYSSMSKYVEEYLSKKNALNENLAHQYTTSELLGREIPKTKEEFDEYRQSVIDAAVSSGEFVGSNEDIANSIDAVLSRQSGFAEFYKVTESGSKGVVVSLKSAVEVLEEVQGGYDGLKEALETLTAEGYLTAESLSKLYELSKDGALAGLDLAKIIERDANGYKLATDALEQYVAALIESYAIQGAFASQKDRENAIENLKTLRAVLVTLAQTQEELAEADESRREELEKQEDMYNDQLDKYKEIIDIRKDLLESYEEEITYQKELEKRQRDVASLQTKLEVAKLDTSAAGQARVRELEAELRSAQEDLEDFTLEHAIDVLVGQLDSQYAEYEAFIKSKLDEITSILNGLDTTPEVEVNVPPLDLSGITSLIETIDEKIDSLSGTPELEHPNVTDHEAVTDNPLGTSTGSTVIIGSAVGAAGTSIDSPTIIGSAVGAAGTSIDSPAIIGSAVGAVDALHRLLPLYHTGGLVGGTATLSSSEEFAKLLKGEFVSTPAQMKQFMDKTLPQIANFDKNGRNEFNAPLIEINCDSITSETLPSFRQVIDQAVTEIKKQFDDGMMRTGYKRQTVARLF